MEDWAEIRRLHRAEGVPIREIARRLNVARNTVKAALASDRPPRYERVPQGSVADGFEPQVRALLRDTPRMTAPEIARRIGWPHSMSPLKKLLTRIRAEYVGGDPDAEVPIDRNVLRPYDMATDPLAEWKTMNETMSENPPGERYAMLLKQYDDVHVGPWQDVTRADADTQAGLASAAVAGRDILEGAANMGAKINGWSFPPLSLGRAGVHDDFLVRGAVQCLSGIVANDPDEAVYVNTATDVDGNALTGSRRYALHFTPDSMPKVKAFWSLTMYQDYNLVANEIDRYSISPRTRDVHLAEDGSFTIFVQYEAPTDPVEYANWLPAPEGNFALILRAYLPEPEIVQQVWQPPPLVARP